MGGWSNNLEVVCYKTGSCQAVVWTFPGVLLYMPIYTLNKIYSTSYSSCIHIYFIYSIVYVSNFEKWVIWKHRWNFKVQVYGAG